MTDYEIYVFILCFVVFSIFTVLFSVMLGYLVSLNIKLIKHGVLDAKIKTEYEKRARKAHPGVGVFLDRFFSVLVCLAMCLIFAFSVYLKLNEDKMPEDMPSLKVVQTGSMSKKHEDNTYLQGIDNQVQTFDLITTYPIPEASELKLYDIVMYEFEGDVILHRIVKIEEPNEKHPNDYWFTLQGDAVSTPDRKPVTHGQMVGIYRGERIPFVGSFVMFMQSPAGYLCILLILIAMIATPILEKKLERAKAERLTKMTAFSLSKKWNYRDLRNILFGSKGRRLFFQSFFYSFWLMMKLRRRR